MVLYGLSEGSLQFVPEQPRLKGETSVIGYVVAGVLGPIAVVLLGLYIVEVQTVAPFVMVNSHLLNGGIVLGLVAIVSALFGYFHGAPPKILKEVKE